MEQKALGALLEARAAVEVVVREHAGRVLSSLVRYLGAFDLAEDALQDALAIALAKWPVEGLPDNPPAWIVTTARRRALDRIRRRTVRRDKQQDVLLLERLERDDRAPGGEDEVLVRDERLALIFTCCHPSLSQEAQVALTLRALGGLSTAEIARCFLVPEPTIAQRIVRAKAKITSAKIPYRVPEGPDLEERLPAVLATLYLAFNEGYSATRGPLVRGDLCDEAIRLARILCELMPDQAEAMGLLALMLLQDSRRSARVDGGGSLLTLPEQDRSLWDRSRIEEGTTLVRRALEARRAGPYQIQAAIAAVHAEARSAEETDWWQIAGLYAALETLHSTPVVALNRAVAVAMAAGPAVGLAQIDNEAVSGALGDYHLLHAVRADLLRRLGRADEAAESYRRALSLVSNDAERVFLEKRLLETLGGSG